MNDITPTSPVISASPACEGDITYTWTYTDCAGNTQDYVHTVTIDIPPFAAIPGTSETVACEADIVVVTPPTVQDACLNDITPTGPVVSASPACEGDITYTWTYTDCAGNTQDYVHTVTIDIPPFAAIPGTSETVACEADIVVVTPPVVQDACLNDITPTGPVISASPVCEGDITYTWTYTDCAGNTQDYVHTVTIDIPPFAAIPGTSETVNCEADIVVVTPPTIQDACLNDITPTGPVISASPACEGDITYTWTYTDCAGNTQDYVHTVTIDIFPFAAIPGTSETVTCEADIVVVTPPTIQDACLNTLIPTGPVVSASPVCEGDITYTWTYTDCAGNTQDYVHTVTIDIPPFAAIPGTSETVACEADIVVVTPPVVQDACLNDITPTGPVISASPVCEGDITYTWTYTDCAGNTQDYVHTVTIDIPPFAAIPGTSETVACEGDIVVVTPPTIQDACLSDITPTGPVISASPVCEGDITYIWTYTDCAGNTQDYVHTVTIDIPPFAAILGTSETVTCEADIVVVTPPTIQDACLSTLTPTGPVVSASPACEGDITYTWTYTDCAGNTQDYVHTVTIDIPPFAAIPGTSETVTCEADIVVVTPPTIQDACLNDITPTGPVVSASPACEGDITYTWTYTDCAGNTQDYVHTVTIDIPPFAAIPGTSETVSCEADIVVVTPPTIQDACLNDITPTGPVVSASPVCEGDITYTWTYTDCAGNTQDYVHTVTIDIPPFAAIPGTSETVTCEADIVVVTPPTIQDACLNDITPTGPVVSASPACEGDITYTWTYTDCAGNTQDYVHTVTIDIPPFAAIPGTSETVSCEADIVVVTPPTIQDACLNDITPTGPVVSASPVCEGDITYTWTYTDCAGNTQDYVHTVTIDIPPFAAIPGTNETVTCEADIVVVTPPTIQDACLNDITPTGPVVSASPVCEGDITYTWTYTDCAGNTQDYVHTVTIDIPPFAAIPGTSETVTCEADIVVVTPLLFRMRV